jgi:hypothetical protein
MLSVRVAPARRVALSDTRALLSYAEALRTCARRLVWDSRTLRARAHAVIERSRALNAHLDADGYAAGQIGRPLIRHAPLPGSR